MKTNVSRYLAAVVVAAMVFLQAGACAGETENTGQNKGDKEACIKKMSRDLQLTPQQEEALTRDREEFTSRSKGLRESIRSARTGLKEELKKSAPDKVKVDSLVAELKDMIGRQMQNRVEKIMNMKKILTPEQLNKMKESMKANKDVKRGKHNKRDKFKKHNKSDKGGDKDGNDCMM